MSDHYQKDNPNNQTSASKPSEARFAASRRLDHDRNSDLSSRNSEELLPHNGLDRDGLFRTPIGFRGSVGDARGYGSRVQGQARFLGQATSSDGRGSDPKTGRVNLTATEIILDSIAKQTPLPMDKHLYDEPEGDTVTISKWNTLVSGAVGGLVILVLLFCLYKLVTR